MNEKLQGLAFSYIFSLLFLPFSYDLTAKLMADLFLYEKSFKIYLCYISNNDRQWFSVYCLVPSKHQ